MRKLVYFFVLIIPFFVIGQNGKSTISISENTKNELKELVKELYDLDLNIPMNISSKDLKSSFKEMSDSRKYDEVYLKGLLEKSKTDSLNPIFIKDSQFLTQLYGESAGKNVKSDLDNYKLFMQFAIYEVIRGDFSKATSNIEIAKNINGEDDCPLCSKLLAIIENNK